ncbi:MAG: hypothetical protein JEZ12_01655 [Desulfobacterium sp.]|nr:hypothetical protein [Desulfobacterium sp.]
MERSRRICRWIAGIVLVSVVLWGQGSPAQEEVTAPLYRYKAYEASTGYYEAYETRPRHQRPLIGIPGIREGAFPYSPSAATVRNRSRLGDSHRAVPFYARRTCESCHTEAPDNIHSVRGNLTCRQCHGGEPIASIHHYWSPLNPIRKHAYVCSKCHQGASASYAGYIIHEPNPALASTFHTFPVLAWVFWIMVGIAVGTFALFIPHTVLWAIRELFAGDKPSKPGRTP